MDSRQARPAAPPPPADSLLAVGPAGGGQHAAAPWAPTGAQARYDSGGERQTPPSALTAPPQPAPSPVPPVAPSPASDRSAARPGTAGPGPGPGLPDPVPGDRSAGDRPAARGGAVPAAAAADSSDGVQTGKQPGAEAPWAFQRQAHWEMPAQPGSVPVARHCAALLLSSWGVGADDVEQIVLLVSELTTNSTLHGRRDMSVDLTLAGSHVDLTVSDYGPVVGGRAGKLPADESGRGLEIVSALADGLHVQRHRTGTNAWASYRLAAHWHH